MSALPPYQPYSGRRGLVGKGSPEAGSFGCGGLRLTVRFGFDVVRCLASITERGTPVLIGEIDDTATVGTDHVFIRFKLVDKLCGVQAALPARNADCHVGHGNTPENPVRRPTESK